MMLLLYPRYEMKNTVSIQFLTLMNIRPLPGIHVSDFLIEFERIFVGKSSYCIDNLKIYYRFIHHEIS